MRDLIILFFFVSKICESLGIEYELIELDIPDMSSLKQQLIHDYVPDLFPLITFLPCDISVASEVDGTIRTLQQKLEEDSKTSKDIHLITLSEGLTMYIEPASMQYFNKSLFDLFNGYGAKISSITDSLVFENTKAEACSTLNNSFLKIFKNHAESKEQVKDFYCPPCSYCPKSEIKGENYDIYHAGTEIDISREYTAVMVLMCLQSQFIEQKTATNPKFSELHKLEREIREIYEDKKTDPSFVRAVEVLNKIKLEGKTDVQIVAEFCESFYTKYGQDFLQTPCANFLLEISNDCRSSILPWNMTLAPKCEKDPPKRTPDRVWGTNSQDFVTRYTDSASKDSPRGR